MTASDSRNTSGTSGFKAPREIILAFNGLRLPMPHDWDIVSMGKRYLCLGPDMHPALELKWEPISGSFSMKKHMKRVMRTYGRGSKVTFHGPPRNGDGTDAGIVFFDWSVGEAHGEGGILFDTDSSAALVFQCNAPFSLDSPEAKAIFDGLHLQHNPIRQWRIYDIQADLPDWLSLDTFSFAPGLFRLDFTGPQNLKFHLLRLGPASMILEHTDLSDWAGNFFATLHPQHGIQLTSPRFGDENGVISLDLSGKTPLAERIVPWRRTHGIFLARHEDETNRILALAASARRPLDMQPLKDIFARYVAIPQNKDTSGH